MLEAAGQQPSNPQEQPTGVPVVDSASESQEESPEELAPAAVQLDHSHSSPLIQLLYAATCETKQQPTLDRLAEAQKLVEAARI